MILRNQTRLNSLFSLVVVVLGGIAGFENSVFAQPSVAKGETAPGQPPVTRRHPGNDPNGRMHPMNGRPRPGMTTGPGGATGPHGDRTGDVNKMRQDAAEMMRQARERMMNMPAEERAALRERHRQSRDARRKANASRQRSRWGVLLKTPEAQEELRLHAERVARLHRLRTLAEDAHKPELLDRVFTLTKREERRHVRKMNGLREATLDHSTPTLAPAGSAEAPLKAVQPRKESPVEKDMNSERSQ